MMTYYSFACCAEIDKNENSDSIVRAEHILKCVVVLVCG